MTTSNDGKELMRELILYLNVKIRRKGRRGGVRGKGEDVGDKKWRNLGRKGEKNVGMGGE